MRLSAGIGAALLTACTAGPATAPQQGTVAPGHGAVAPSRATIDRNAQSARRPAGRPARRAGQLVRPSGRACSPAISVGEAPRQIGGCATPGPVATVKPPPNSG
ncbi:MAG TPA: hypothetical protein VGI64_15005 [Streptosporangiaceae bacterium]